MRPACDIPEIFADALRLPAEARRGFIADHCAGDADAVREVEDLLLEHEQAAAADFLSKAAVELEAGHILNGDADQRVGQTLGRYKLLRRLGSGGMGSIYLAARQDDFEKQAAVKIIKRGMDTDAILRRFRNERQILATLEHPNIARLIDGGTTDDGLPFFVLEYVDGVDIREYCRDLGQKEVLRLFLRVCSAVSFAHQKLVVHRDLKPSNILVDRDGQPKLLDFGIAKLLNQTDQEETHTVHRMMTPAYASPEQVAGAAVSTSMDVYSLGKILAEIVNEKTSRSDADLLRVLETAQHEDVPLRYASVDRFADDIKRFLDDLPVAARKVSLAYRARKFARRNRAKVAFASLFLLTLVAGLAATIWKTAEARRERQLADRRFENLRRLSDSFVTELHSAIQNLPGSLPARQLLLKRATEQLDTLASESDGNRDLQADLANAYYNLSSLPDMPIAEKEQILRKAEGLANGLLAQDATNAHYNELLGQIDLELADVRKVRGSVAEGLQYVLAGVERLKTVNEGAPADAGHLRAYRDAVSMKSGMLTLAGRTEDGLNAAREAEDVTNKLLAFDNSAAGDDLLGPRVHLQIGHILTLMGRYDEALTELTIDADAERAAHERDPNDTSINFYLWAVKRRIAIANELSGRSDAALYEAAEAMAIIDRLRTSSPRDIGYNRNLAITEVLTGRLLLERHQPRLALPHYRRALELSEFVVNADPEYLESKADIARAKGGLGHALFLTGQKDRGRQLLAESLQTFEEVANIDTENSVLERDRSETAAWAAADN